MIYFVIPAYNEEQNLPSLLDSLAGWARQRGFPAHVVVVDDGSRDRTAQIALDFTGLPVTLVRHPTNLSVHRAFDSGFRAALDLDPADADLIVTLEADNTSSLAILDEMVRRAAGGFDLVLASCYAPGGAVQRTSLYRRVLSTCANMILRQIPGMPRVHTFSSFYRVYQASLIRRLYHAYGDAVIEESGFVCVVELLLKCSWIGATIAEIPMILDCGLRVGATKMKTLRTIRGYLALLLHAVSGRLKRPAGHRAGEFGKPARHTAQGRG